MLVRSTGTISALLGIRRAVRGRWAQPPNMKTAASDVLKVRARVTGAEHGEMQVRTDGYMTAWMRCHLQGGQEAGKVFLGENAEILGNPNWQDIEKNH